MVVRRHRSYGKEHESATRIRQSVATAWWPQLERGLVMMLTDSPMYYAGGGFPWGLLIIGGILYFLWRNGMFGGPGRHGNGHRYGGYGSGYGPAQMPGAPGAEQGGDPVFRGPRGVFDEWHRQAHETAGTPAHTQAPAAPPAPPAPPAAAATEASASGESESAR